MLSRRSSWPASSTGSISRVCSAGTSNPVAITGAWWPLPPICRAKRPDRTVRSTPSRWVAGTSRHGRRSRHGIVPTPESPRRRTSPCCRGIGHTVAGRRRWIVAGLHRRPGGNINAVQPSRHEEVEERRVDVGLALMPTCRQRPKLPQRHPHTMQVSISKQHPLRLTTDASATNGLLQRDPCRVSKQRVSVIARMDTVDRPEFVQ